MSTGTSFIRDMFRLQALSLPERRMEKDGLKGFKFYVERLLSEYPKNYEKLYELISLGHFNRVELKKCFKKSWW